MKGRTKMKKWVDITINIVDAIDINGSESELDIAELIDEKLNKLGISSEEIINLSWEILEH